MHIADASSVGLNDASTRLQPTKEHSGGLEVARHDRDLHHRGAPMYLRCGPARAERAPQQTLDNSGVRVGPLRLYEEVAHRGPIFARAAGFRCLVGLPLLDP